MFKGLLYTLSDPLAPLEIQLETQNQGSGRWEIRLKQSGLEPSPGLLLCCPNLHFHLPHRGKKVLLPKQALPAQGHSKGRGAAGLTAVSLLSSGSAMYHVQLQGQPLLCFSFPIFKMRPVSVEKLKRSAPGKYLE